MRICCTERIGLACGQVFSARLRKLRIRAAGLTRADIANSLAIGWSGASKIVDQVEAARHCRRRPNPDDARTSLITLTPGRRARLNQATICFVSELQVRAAVVVTPAQLTNLSSTLSQLRTTSPPHGNASGQGTTT